MTDRRHLLSSLRVAAVFCAVMGSAAALGGHHALAADNPVSATLSPTQVVLTPKATSTVILLIANAGPGAATNLAVSATPSDPSVAVTNASTGAAQATIPATSSIVLIYNVTRQIEGTGQDVGVVFLVSYVQSVNGESGMVVANLTVKAAPSLPVVDAKIQSNVTNINENRSGEAILVITNPRDTIITISSIRVTAPQFVDVGLHCPSAKDDLTVSGGTTAGFNVTRCLLVITARSDQIVHMDLTTTDTVAPGPRTVVVEVTATDPDSHATGSSVATLPLTVDVFAEADVLKTLGVPIFLLLPGFIVVVVVQTFLSVIGPKNYLQGIASDTTVGKLASMALAKGPDAKPHSKADAASPPNPPASAASTLALGLVASIILSLMIAKVYPWLTLIGPPFKSRNYEVAYGFRDFYFAIAYSLIIALVIWLALVAFRPVDRLVQDWSWRGLQRIFPGLKTKPAAGSAEPAAQPPPPPQVSPDGHFYWDGHGWVAFRGVSGPNSVQWLWAAVRSWPAHFGADRNRPGRG